MTHRGQSGAWCVIEDSTHPTRLAAAGGALARACRALGLEVKTAAHEVFGKVNLYPVETLDRWRAGLSKIGLPPHVEQHVATMAQLHQDNRYDRMTGDVEHLTGIPPESIEAFVAAHRDRYLG